MQYSTQMKAQDLDSWTGRFPKCYIYTRAIRLEKGQVLDLLDVMLTSGLYIDNGLEAGMEAVILSTKAATL